MGFFHKLNEFLGCKESRGNAEYMTYTSLSKKISEELEAFNSKSHMYKDADTTITYPSVLEINKHSRLERLGLTNSDTYRSLDRLIREHTQREEGTYVLSDKEYFKITYEAISYFSEKYPFPLIDLKWHNDKDTHGIRNESLYGRNDPCHIPEHIENLILSVNIDKEDEAYVVYEKEKYSPYTKDRVFNKKSLIQFLNKRGYGSIDNLKRKSKLHSLESLLLVYCRVLYTNKEASYLIPVAYKDNLYYLILASWER